jgi:hypothetical protein
LLSFVRSLCAAVKFEPTEINVAGCPSHSDSALKLLLANPKALRRLDISGCDQLRFNGDFWPTAFVNLRVLVASGVRLDHEQDFYPLLQSMTNLRELTLIGTGFDVGRVMECCPALEMLRLVVSSMEELTFAGSSGYDGRVEIG